MILCNIDILCFRYLHLRDMSSLREHLTLQHQNLPLNQITCSLETHRLQYIFLQEDDFLLVAGIDQSRQYEINVKFVTTAKEIDEATASLMRMPS